MRASVNNRNEGIVAAAGVLLLSLLMLILAWELLTTLVLLTVRSLTPSRRFLLLEKSFLVNFFLCVFLKKNTSDPSVILSFFGFRSGERKMNSYFYSLI